MSNLNIPTTPDHDQLVGAVLAVLDRVTTELQEIQAESDVLIAQLNEIPYMKDVNPTVVVGAFFELAGILVDELRVLLESDLAEKINDAVLEDFANNGVILSASPDLFSVQALSGSENVPLMQANIGLRLRVLVIVMHFLDLQKAVAGMNEKQLGITEVDLKLALSGLAEVVRSSTGDIYAYYNRMVQESIDVDDIVAIAEVIMVYLVAIRALIGPRMRTTTVDLFPNIISNLHAISQSVPTARTLDLYRRKQNNPPSLSLPPTSEVES